MPHEDSGIADVRPLVRMLGKPPEQWQRRDLMRVCAEREVQVVNLRYPALDGKLRELRVPVSDARSLERILAAGERVDGSSLFPGLFDTRHSDLYVVPVYRWAFLNPFADDELDIVCRFANRDGLPCSSTPDNVLATIAERLAGAGHGLLALAELEFYLIQQRSDDRFTGKTQRNYHQSAPYLHGREIADQILRLVSIVTGRVKYCHSEVGYIDRLESDDPELHGRRVEQYELEFELMPIADLAAWVAVTRWLIRVIADRHGASVTYVPKLDEDMAGSGMHLHLAFEARNGVRMLDDGGELSRQALGMIGGLLGRAEPLTAFGGSVASSYLRLVPGQEAPTRVCWGRHNRSSLLRVPLSFATRQRLDLQVNPLESADYPSGVERPTIEYRSPDGSAFCHLLLSAVALAVEEGIDNEEALALARRLEVSGETAGAEAFDELPQSASAAARRLVGEREFFERGGIPAGLIDFVAGKLEAEGDDGLAARLRLLPAAERLRHSRRLMHKDLHKH